MLKQDIEKIHLQTSHLLQNITNHAMGSSQDIAIVDQAAATTKLTMSSAFLNNISINNFILFD